jgi:hypothetical protein
VPANPILFSGEPFSFFGHDDLRLRGAWITHADLPVRPFAMAFRLNFSLDEARRFCAHVTADERYQLFLDGENIGRGSERGDLQNWFFETYQFDLSPGAHVLTAMVWRMRNGAPRAQISAAPGFWFCPQHAPEAQLLATGVADWQTRLLPGYEFVPAVGAGATGLNVQIRGEKFAWGFEKNLDDERDWQRALISHPARFCGERETSSSPHALTPATLPPQFRQIQRVGRVRHVATLEASGDEIFNTRDLPMRSAENLECETVAWQAVIEGGSTVRVAPHTRRRVLLDLGNYFCAYPEVVTSGGAGSTLRIHWQEALYHAPQANGKRSKGHRDEIEGKFFRARGLDADGTGDTFFPNSGAQRHWSTPWWQAGRYVEICVQTQDEPLVIESFALCETRYPLEMENEFCASDERLQNALPIFARTLQMCAHETWMDCPFYEQTQYMGDARLEMLAGYVMARDDRLARKTLRQFHDSRLREGLTLARTPSRVEQVIPPFSLLWIGALHDFALWRDDADFVRELLPGMRAVMAAFSSFRNKKGLLQAPFGWKKLHALPDEISAPVLRGARYALREGASERSALKAPLGWNFVDWVPSWKAGVPPDGAFGVSGILNWQCALAARQAAELENWFGDSRRADEWRELAQNIGAATTRYFWNEARGLFADDLEGRFFSEHAQSLAVLSGLVDETRQQRIAQNLGADKTLARATIYFSHYLFEAYRELGRADLFFERLDLWLDLKARGFVTTFEEADANTTRSDCHGWGAHPLYHFFATILGIRPVAPGFSKIEIAPQLGALQSVSGVLPVPRGTVKAQFFAYNQTLRAAIELPAGVEAELVWHNQKIALRAPRCELSLARDEKTSPETLL